MKQFLIKISLFLLFVVAVDFLFGICMDRIIPQVRGGEYGRDNYICNQAKEDFLVFGSSRAEFHYDAQMLEDSLKFTTYNCGQIGHTIILNYARLIMNLERRTPKMVVYDITPGYDLLVDIDNNRDLNFLKLHYDRTGVSDIVNDLEPKERLKMISSMYKYNSSFLQLLLVSIYPVSEPGVKGFRTYSNQNEVWLTPPEPKTEWMYDSLKIAYLEKFIKKCKGVSLTFVVSPMWQGINSEVLKPAVELSRKYNTPLLDYSNDTQFLHNKDLFWDYAHLNAEGAHAFTKRLIEDLRKDR